MAYDHSKVTAYIGKLPYASISCCRLPINMIPGGNSLDKAPTGRVTDFVRENGGHTVITKVHQQFL